MPLKRIGRFKIPVRAHWKIHNPNQAHWIDSQSQSSTLERFAIWYRTHCWSRGIPPKPSNNIIYEGGQTLTLTEASDCRLMQSFFSLHAHVIVLWFATLRITNISTICRTIDKTLEGLKNRPQWVIETSKESLWDLLIDRAIDRRRPRQTIRQTGKQTDRQYYNVEAGSWEWVIEIWYFFRQVEDLRSG